MLLRRRMRIKITKKWWLKQKWHFTVYAGNGKKVCQSENYTNRQDCIDTIDLLQNGLKDARVITEEEEQDFD